MSLIADPSKSTRCRRHYQDPRNSRPRKLHVMPWRGGDRHSARYATAQTDLTGNARPPAKGSGRRLANGCTAPSSARGARIRLARRRIALRRGRPAGDRALSPGVRSEVARGGTARMSTIGLRGRLTALPKPDQRRFSRAVTGAIRVERDRCRSGVRHVAVVQCGAGSAIDEPMRTIVIILRYMS